MCGRFKSQLCYLNFFWVPGKATQNLWNECNGRIVWEPPIPSVVTFFSVLTLRARVGGGGHGQESGENADASFLISLSVCLLKFLQCGLNPWLLSSLFPFAYLSQLYARPFCEKRAACEGCVPLWACMCVCVWVGVYICVCGCVCVSGFLPCKTKSMFCIRQRKYWHTYHYYIRASNQNGQLHATLHRKKKKKKG